MTLTIDPVEENGRVKVPQILVYLLIAAVGWGISAYVSYTAAMGNLNVRVSVLESSRPEVERRLTSIETKIDVLINRK